MDKPTGLDKARRQHRHGHHLSSNCSPVDRGCPCHASLFAVPVNVPELLGCERAGALHRPELGERTVSTTRPDTTRRSNSYGSRTCSSNSVDGAKRSSDRLPASASTVTEALRRSSSEGRKTGRCISRSSRGRAGQHKYLMRNSDHDACDRRDRLEPIIRARFKERGQSDHEATAYIEDVCWERLAEAIARVRQAIGR
jgi:hypothetical protein